jgi:hypothetical protein
MHGNLSVVWSDTLGGAPDRGAASKALRKPGAFLGCGCEWSRLFQDRREQIAVPGKFN